MKKLLPIFLAALLISCVQGVEKRYKDVSVEEAYNLIRENENNSKLVVIDVRPKKDYAQGHIPGAINIVFSVGFKSKIEGLDKNKTYLVYCKTGRSSKIAAEIMVSSGFKNVYNMLGGIKAWRERGYPIVK